MRCRALQSIKGLHSDFTKKYKTPCFIERIHFIDIGISGNARVPGGPRGLQIRSAPATVGTGGFDSHTFPPLKWVTVIWLPIFLNY